MNTKVLLIFFAVLVVFLVLPVVVNIIQAANVPEGETLNPNAPKAAPLLNEANLVGSAWTVKTAEMPIAVTISLNAGGQAEAKVPAAFAALARAQLGSDTIMGTWSAQGDKLIAKVEFKGQTHTVACDIIGNKLFYDNKEIVRAY